MSRFQHFLATEDTIGGECVGFIIKGLTHSLAFHSHEWVEVHLRLMLPASDHWTKQNMTSRVMGEYFIWQKKKQFISKESFSILKKSQLTILSNAKIVSKACYFLPCQVFSDFRKNSSPFYKGNPIPCDNHNLENINMKVNSTFDLQILDFFRFFL